MKNILKVLLKTVIALVFVYIGTVAICGFNMMQTTSAALSLTHDDGSITSYTIDFKKSEAYITDYNESGMHRHEEAVSLNATDVFKVKARLALSFVSLWSEQYGNDAATWRLSRTRTDVTNISSGAASRPFTYEIAKGAIMDVFIKDHL